MRFWLIAGLEIWCPEMSNLSVTLIAHLIVLCQRLAVPTGIFDTWNLNLFIFRTENLVNILLAADSKDNNRNNLQSTTFTSWTGSNTHAVHLLTSPQTRHVAISNHAAIDFC